MLLQKSEQQGELLGQARREWGERTKGRGHIKGIFKLKKNYWLPSEVQI